MLSLLSQGLGKVSLVTGKAVSFLTLAMVLAMFGSALISNLFNINFIALQESVTWLHAVVFMLGAAFTLNQDEHVRVDIFYSRMNKLQKAWVNLVGSLVFLLPMCGFILFSSWRYVTLSWQLQEASAEAGGLPGVFLLKSLVLVMAVLLIIEALNQVIINLLTIKQSKQGEAQ